MAPHSMLIEHRTYTISPGRIEEFLDLLTHSGWPALRDNLGECLGFFVDEDGERITHIWRYSDHTDHEFRRDLLLKDPRFLEYAATVEAEGFITNIDTQWLRPTEFCPTLNSAG